jgi:hypothetical protein
MSKNSRIAPQGPTRSSRTHAQTEEGGDVLTLLTFFVSGRWEEMAGIEEDAREFVLEVTQALKHHDEGTIRQLFAKAQESLLSHRGKWSLKRVQQEPAFSEFALKNMINLAQAWKRTGDAGFREQWMQIFKPESGEEIGSTKKEVN